MTAFLRNTFLAAVAVSSLAGSALADQNIPSCSKTSTESNWGNRCCEVSGKNCLGGGRGGNHDSTGGRGGPNGPAGAK